MAEKARIRSSIREDYRLTEDRRSLVERYMIDAAEAQARARRAADEQARRRAEEEAAARAAEEAKRAAEEQERRAAEEAAAHAAKEAKRAARADDAATRMPPTVEPVADLAVAAFRPDELPVALPVVAEAPSAAEIAEPPEQEELKHATSLPIYGWFDAPALRKEMLEPDAFGVGPRAGK